jgi:hypothetical protein
LGCEERICKPGDLTEVTQEGPIPSEVSRPMAQTYSNHGSLSTRESNDVLGLPPLLNSLHEQPNLVTKP